MTIRAEVEGVGVLEFPDGTSPTVIQAAVRRTVASKNAKPSTGEDVAKTIPAAAVRGVTNLLGSPADLWEMISGGLAKGVGWAGEKTGLADPGFADRLAAVSKPELGRFTPNSENIRSAVAPVTGPLYKPQTLAGKATTGLLEGALSGPFGRGMAGMGALGGLSSEMAGAATEGTEYEPWARLLAGVTVPMGAQAAKNLKDTPGRMIREATGDISPDQFADAQRKIEMGRKFGIDLAAPEALGPSSIQQLMADVAASKSGGQVVNQFAANRPTQVRNAVNTNLIDPIAPRDLPDVNMARAKQAATDVISNAERNRSKAVRGFYDTARREYVPQAKLDAISAEAAANNPFLDPTSQKAATDFVEEVATVSRNPAAPNNAAALDKVYQANRNKVELPAIGATPEQKTAAAAIRPLNQLLDDALRSESTGIRTGRDEYKRITEQVIDPLTSGPVGRVAGKTGFDAGVPENLRPIQAIADEKVARPEGIRELYTQLGTVDRKAFPGVARTWLENAFDQATQRVQAGENRMVGANFAKAVYGTDQQIANFAETMRGVAVSNGSKNPDAFVKGATNLMEVLQMTGKVPGIGSPTGGRLASNEMAQSSKIAGLMEATSTTPLGPTARRIREWTMQGNYKKLAEVLTDPDSIRKIQELGKYRPDTTTAQALAISILQMNRATSGGQ